MSNLLPLFPYFASVSTRNKVIYETSTKMDELYSDFNFTSVYTWNISGDHEFSVHNGNLVLKLADYVTGEPLLSILGANDVTKTINAVLSYAEETYNLDTLKLLPEQTVRSIYKCDDYTIVEDENNYDYIFSLEELAKLEGRKFKTKRQAANRCQKSANKLTIEEFNTVSVEIKAEISEMLHAWVKDKEYNGKENENSDTELKAFDRVFDNFDKNQSLKLNLIRSNGKLVGFSLDEFEVAGYVLSHYCKTMPSIPGLTEYFNRELAKSFFNRGNKYWNWEQDTGNEKLRRLKLGYRPHHYNKKYTLSARKKVSAAETELSEGNK